MPVSVTRYRYHDHISERFAYAYADQIGAWCSGHHLALTGHMMKEPDLMSQTMALGEAKRDYPACIGYRFPWFEKYKRIEDYFARVYTALVRGKPVVKIGVIHPVESYWLKWGSEETTGEERREMDTLFSNLTQWLLYGLLDFDFISESLLEKMPESGESRGREDSLRQKAVFRAGTMGYEVILVPDCLTLRENTVKRLEAFAEKGGKVFFLGRMPEYMGVRPMDNSRLERTGTLLPAARETICRALEPWRMVSVRDGRGKRSGNLLYQMRQDGDNRWLFLAHCEKPENPDDTAPEDWTVQVAGKWNVVCYDAMEGEIVPVAAHIREGEGVTEWQVRSYAQDSHLYCLKAGEAQAADCTKAGKAQAPDRPKSCFSQRKQLPVPETVSITLEEPNVLVLDMARFMLDGGQWREREEILRLDNVIRAELGYPRREDAYAQPWIYGENAYEHTARVNLEAMYLLGDFGVRVSGSRAVLTELEGKIGFGNICHQGLPFYGGNLVYGIPLELPERGELAVQIPKFRNPLIEVILDGRESRDLFQSPYLVCFSGVEKGRHLLELRAYGNSRNTFGQLHNCSEEIGWCGPDAWRTEGVNWAYEYQLTRTGILVRPLLEFVTLENG